MNAEEYWRAVRQHEAALPADVVWLYPLDSDTKGTHERSMDVKGNYTGAPVLVEAERLLAARRIVEKTHRLAKEDEVKAYMERVDRNSAKNIKKESLRAMKNITLSPTQFNDSLLGKQILVEEETPPPKKAA